MNIIYVTTTKTDVYEFVKQKLKEDFNISDVSFNRNPKGKPYIENGNIYFNITHSKDFTAVAIGKAQVGIDAEYLGTADLRVIKRFTKPEQDYIRKDDSNNRFFEIWTKKEAYLKYKGVGLSGGLNSFNVLEIPQMFKSFVIGKVIVTVCSDEQYSMEDKNEIQQTL